MGKTYFESLASKMFYQIEEKIGKKEKKSCFHLTSKKTKKKRSDGFLFKEYAPSKASDGHLDTKIMNLVYRFCLFSLQREFNV